MTFDLRTECRSSTTEEKAKFLGFASMVMFMCRRYSTFRMLTLDFWLSPAIDHRQIVFFFACTGLPMGYVTWAYLAPDAEERLLTDPEFLLHPSEWNEGGRTWIIDFCFPSGGAKEAVARLKDIFREEGVSKVHWMRRGNDYTPCGNQKSYTVKTKM
ncbi:RTX toxin acyltransferase [Pseudomonas brassicacearum]|uniref:toxin-activating lysine-acyltransferase n=1 Tax=Pseudomonas brassicacearum TaxID=930166 RepID=UPI00042F41F1|nr:toxin-activating lysine-acyltransferase [Pseudomonas brassicacearum]AHL34944.1 RTX toxin acyltransferase [Pseudomonas brassicacearum]